MKSGDRRQRGKGGLDLIEEATHLLRRAPMRTLAWYYAGSIPFVLGFLYFWADMGRNPFAGGHLAESSLGVAGLFVWMKFFQAMFARDMRAWLAAEPPPRWTVGRCWNILVAQTRIQPSGFFLLPLSLLPVLPMPRVFAFYQSVTALAEEGEAEDWGLMKRSWRQAAMWPRQNHILLVLFMAFGFLVFLNWAMVCSLLPHLGRILLGIESVFTRSGWAFLNTTFFAAVLALTYLCMDPVVKVCYVLRCFHGDAVESGEDLKAEMKRLGSMAQPVTRTLIFVLLLAGAQTVHAAAGDSWAGVRASGAVARLPVAAEARSGIAPRELDRTIERVIHKRKYTWRIPREKLHENEMEKGAIALFLERVGKMARKWVKAFLNWIEEIIDRLLHRQRSGRDGSGYGWIMTLELLLYGLLAIAVIVLGALLYRVWRRRRQAVAPVRSEAVQTTPDLLDEAVGPDRLPEDGWTKLARELLEQGDLRLALRAFYLASLAHLAGRQLISIARFKSNRDYERELRRRAHAFPSLVPVFGGNVSILERVWYGMHQIDRAGVEAFAASVERMKAV